MLIALILVKLLHLNSNKKRESKGIKSSFPGQRNYCTS